MAICFLQCAIIICMALITSVLGFSPNLPTSTFDESFTRLFGNDHVTILDNAGKSVQISLDQSTGSGFISRKIYSYAYFSASIKLPADYTAGVVATYYTSNSAQHRNDHDEIDFEFLGNVQGQQWLVQTNIYGNGSESRGREERYNLWFDPTKDFHNYGILWTSKGIVFYVDGVPIRETQKVDAMGGDFPSKPMSLYATIWDGSSWATNGGKHKIDFKYAPFNAQYSNFVLHECSTTHKAPALCDNGLMATDRGRMMNFRAKYLRYSYCTDRSRYPTPLPECAFNYSTEGKP